MNWFLPSTFRGLLFRIIVFAFGFLIIDIAILATIFPHESQGFLANIDMVLVILTGLLIIISLFGYIYRLVRK